MSMKNVFGWVMYRFLSAQLINDSTDREYVLMSPKEYDFDFDLTFDRHGTILGLNHTLQLMCLRVYNTLHSWQSIMRQFKKIRRNKENLVYSMDNKLVFSTNSGQT